MLVSFFTMDISDFSYFIVVKLLKIRDFGKFLKDYPMLKILNNDKFTTAQNRHSLVSLKIPILNTLPVRAKVKANRSPILLPLQGEGVSALIPRALPWAGNWLPFQGARGEGCGGLPLKGAHIVGGACPAISVEI